MVNPFTRNPISFKLNSPFSETLSYKMDFALIWFIDLASEQILIVRKCALISETFLG